MIFLRVNASGDNRAEPSLDLEPSKLLRSVVNPNPSVAPISFHLRLHLQPNLSFFPLSSSAHIICPQKFTFPYCHRPPTAPPTSTLTTLTALTVPSIIFPYLPQVNPPPLLPAPLALPYPATYLPLQWQANLARHRSIPPLPYVNCKLLRSYVLSCATEQHQQQRPPPRYPPPSVICISIRTLHRSPRILILIPSLARKHTRCGVCPSSNHTAPRNESPHGNTCTHTLLNSAAVTHRVRNQHTYNASANPRARAS